MCITVTQNKDNGVNVGEIKVIRIHFMYDIFNFSVMFAYEQALLCLGHHPDIWIEGAAFLQETSKVLTEKGVSIYVCVPKK